MLAMNAESAANYPPISDSAADLLIGLPDRLQSETHAMMLRRDALIMAASRIPPITNDEVAGKVADFTKQLTEHLKMATEWKDAAKAPVLKLDRAIMDQHKTLCEVVTRTKDSVSKMQTDYLMAKAAAERAARQEAERIAREEANKAAREAEAAAAALATEDDIDAALAAEQAAIEAQKAAEAAELAANAKPADLSRVTGAHGTTSSLRGKWVFRAETINMDKIDLEALRPYLSGDDLHKAIRKYIAADRHELKGVVIEQEFKAR